MVLVELVIVVVVGVFSVIPVFPNFDIFRILNDDRHLRNKNRQSSSYSKTTKTQQWRNGQIRISKSGQREIPSSLTLITSIRAIEFSSSFAHKLVYLPGAANGTRRQNFFERLIDSAKRPGGAGAPSQVVFVQNSVKLKAIKIT